MKKRVLSAFMALALCLTLLPTAAFAEGEDVSISGGVIGGGETGGEGGGIYVAPGSPTEGGGGTCIPGEDTRTEIWCVSKPDSIGRSYDGTTDGGTIPIDLTFTDGTNEIKLKEGTGFTAKKTFDSADAGWHTVTVEIALIGEAAVKYKLKAGEEKFEIRGAINRAYPKLTVSLSQTTCTAGEKLLPLLSVSGVQENAAVTYYYAPINSGYLEFEGSEAVPAIDENTAISEPGTYYVYAKSGETKNYEEDRSATVALTVTEPAAASVTKADGTDGGTYKTLPAALNAAQDGDTVKLLANHTTNWSDVEGGEYATLAVVKKTLTLDLNGMTVDYLTVGDVVPDEEGGILDSYNGNLTVVDNIQGGSCGKIKNLEFVKGSLAIQGGRIGDYNGGNLTCNGNSGTVTISGGTVCNVTVGDGATVTVTGGSGHCGTWQAGSAAVTVTGGAFGDVTFANPRNVQLTGGSFEKIAVSGASAVSLSALLANGYAFYSTSGAYQSAEGTELSSVQVQKHTHNIDTDGKCTECGAAFGASVTARVGGTSDVSYYDTIDSAFTAAHAGDTVTLLADITSRDGSIFVSGGPYTLDLNGHRIDASGRDLVVGDMDNSEALLSGELTVKDSSTDSTGYVQYLKLWNGDLTVESGNFHQIIETGPGSVGTITITGGTAEDVTHTSPNVTFQLSGGTFDWINISSTCGENVFPSDLLADGYAYANKNSDAIQNGYAEGFSSVSGVKVVKHDHTWNDGTCACGYTCSHTAVDENGNCTVCKKPMAAMVTKGGESRAYAALNDALSAAAGGGTVKLLANAGEITIGSPLKLDLNGKTAAKLTVTGDVTLASLLPEGCAFKSGTTWITDLTGKELTHVSMAKLPIQSMKYPTEMSMTYGGTGMLQVTVKKEPGTGGAVSFQWYKVEDGKETAVGDATTKNQFDFYALKLPAGKHIFRFSATCDGYKKMSQDIVVTVQKADISASRITPPTAQENLTYTGQEQALITAGSVTSGGTMQYSLTENGTYSQNIPVGTDAGTYTVWYRVIGDENHNDTTPASVAVSIGKKPLTITGVTAASKPYDGTTNADISSVTFDNVTVDNVTLNPGTDYTVTASFDDAGVGSGKNVTATVTLMGQAAKNYALEQSSFPTTASITKAAAPDFTKETALVIVNGHEKTYTVTLPALPTLETPKEYGAPTYELGEIKLGGGYYTSGAKVENGELTLPIQKNDVETTGSVGTVTVVIKSANYEDITLTVNVNATNKLVPTVTAPTANALTYNGAEQTLVTAGKTTGGTMLYRLGDSAWSEQLPTAKNAGKYTVWYKVQGDAEYADVAEQSLTVTAAKKAVTVTALDKNAHTGSTAPDLSSPEADKNYKVEGLLGADTLSGTVTLTYAQTPDMSKPGKTAINIAGTLSNDNYEITYVSGTLTVSDRPSSGGGSSSGGSSGGGGGSSSSSKPSTGTGKTDTTTKPDGTKVETTTKSDGTTVKTETKKDGSVTKTETKKDGSSVTESKAADGSTGTVKTDKNGQTEAETKLSAKAVEDAKKNGEAVKAPVEVQATRNSNTAPVVKVELPGNSGDTKVEIPVSNVKPGTVAVLVHPDGTEEIVKNTLPTADGIQLTVNVGATVKIVDNSKDFADTRDHWAKDAIDFISARGLVNGTGERTFSPNAPTTRAQLWTILARQNDADLSGGASWYEKAQAWAKDNGISDGTNPDGTVSRAQMVTMLHRAAGSPEVERASAFADVSADSYYAEAVAWAVKDGITAGVGNRKFDPNGACTRAQIATFLHRSYQSK